MGELEKQIYCTLQEYDNQSLTMAKWKPVNDGCPQMRACRGVSWNTGVRGTSGGLDFMLVRQGTYKQVLECRMEVRGEQENKHHILVLRNKVDWPSIASNILRLRMMAAPTSLNAGGCAGVLENEARSRLGLTLVLH